ncbi:hypothetical protein PIB30_082766 [Stylosanthes scabra]|uniref:Flavin-containing monooxygenase n=1 Tax=Stylosanthes scabra TaxID=79078 RepID=A0ABU6ZQR7_9FABA|nr:hypothetical protein [Stylosanthes scabra]
MEKWNSWGGNVKPFSSKGTWHISLQHTKNFSTEVYEAEFVILCIGKYSGVPNIPLFPAGQGPEVFKGKVLHSMDYSALDNEVAAELIKDKRVTVIGSQKSAIDIATECAHANGVKYPCTMIQRSAHWFFPELNIWGIDIEYFYANRFSELLFHKPGEPFLLSLLATLLSPLRWGVAKVAESYLKWRLPMKKYGLVPSYSILEAIASCRIGVLPDENFYDKLKEGSILIKKSQSFGFCKEGLIIDGEAKPLETDIVILATGYKGDEKLQSIFKSPLFQKYIVGSKTSSLPLYRQIIHPQIPQLAIIGYAESLSNLYSSEMRCQWLAHFLDGNIELPTISEMEKDIKMCPPPTPCTPPRDRRRSVPASRRLVLATLTHTLVSLPPPLTALSCVVPPVPPPSSPQGSSKFVVPSHLLPSNRRIILSRSSRLAADSCSPHRRFISASWNGCEVCKI